MGNRAYIVFTDKEQESPAVYLHWNGGPESVYSFVRVLNHYGIRKDAQYRCARFCQLVGNYFGGTLSLGIESYETLTDLDCGDNGLFVFDEFDNVRRWVNNYKTEGSRLCWQSQAWIDDEKAQAAQHEYNCKRFNNICKEIMKKNRAAFRGDADR